MLLHVPKMLDAAAALAMRAALAGAGGENGRSTAGAQVLRLTALHRNLVRRQAAT